MNAIAVVDKNWGIGKDNSLLTHLSGDLKYFKEKTLGKVVIMGRKTMESLPNGKPLPDRTTIILTANMEICNEGNLIACHTKGEVLERVKSYKEDEVFIAGGEQIYKLFAPECTNWYITKMDKSFEADKSLHNLDQDSNWRLSWESPLQEENGISYKFVRYEKKGY